MIRCLTICLLLAGFLRAQTVPPRKTLPAPPAPRAKGQTSGAAASPKAPTARSTNFQNLKFPPLHALVTPQEQWITLPNGLKILLLPDHQLPAVAGAAFIRAGTLFDPALEAGLASLTATLLRQGGTQSKTAEELDEALDSLGASIDTSAGRLYSIVSFSALAESAPQVLSMFHEVLTSPALREERVDLAKAQLRNSVAHRNDQAPELVARELASLVYGRNTPYGQLAGHATVARIGRSSVAAFHRSHYRPDTTIIGIHGDFDPAAMKARLENIFGTWRAPEAPPAETPQPSAEDKGGVYLGARQDLSRLYFAIGGLAPELDSKDYPALEVAAAILANDPRSRLYQRLVARSGDVYEISAAVRPAYGYPGLVLVSGSAKPYAAAQALAGIKAEIGLLPASPITDQELREAKEAVVRKLVFAADPARNMIVTLLSQESAGYPRDFLQQYQKALAAVTRADVVRVAKLYLDPAALTVVAAANPGDMIRPLTSAGPVKNLDLTIPGSAMIPAPSDAASLARGKEILARLQAASGGSGRIAAIRDFTQDLEFSMTNGEAMTETERWIYPSVWRQDSLFRGRRTSVFWDGTNGALRVPEGTAALSGNLLLQAKSSVLRLYPRLLAGSDVPGQTVNAVAGGSIEIADGDGQMVRMVIDDSTGLPSRIVYETVPLNDTYPVTVEVLIGEFQEADGIRLPARLTLIENGRKVAGVAVKNIRINQGLKVQDLQRLQ